ncbi:hypothetical protein EKO23_06290 [Nocardioides guangzhouensis]|uniref:Uncharacterized protein n=1 Tax=Nocardioides guangzhouensis TaxID=2497878 RepID=A0A4Q4ZHD2_9ACTN|nr:hypothetical protein [Nocardioides guangzhouensis]RYP87215.1 hypothetical protein EKO23_06290 [Nocardioides guangzhouensis]
MPTVDLATPANPPPTPPGTLEGLPRRLALTLLELRLLSERAGGAPLPFDVVERTDAGPLQDRLGQSRQSADDEAYAAALDTLHDPAEALARRGLLTGDAGAIPDAGVVGALGLLATPELALDLDVVVDTVRGRAWHRQRAGAVASLSTVDGIVFELAWFGTDQWAAELARMAVVPEDVELGDSTVPDVVDLPYELLDAGAEALRSGRADLLSTVVAHHTGSTVDGAGSPLDDAMVSAVVGALVGETQGRLRALVADVGAGGSTVGVLSWVLLADGWRVLRPHQEQDAHRVEVRRVEPADLASVLGPVLAEVTA